MSFLYAILILICIALVLLVLVQSGKGAGAGLSIGGGMSQTMFGGSGGRDFFIKLTAGLAFAFFVLCMILARVSTKSQGAYKGLMSGASVPASAPAAPVSPASPAASHGTTAAGSAAAPVAPIAPAVPAGGSTSPKP